MSSWWPPITRRSWEHYRAAHAVQHAHHGNSSASDTDHGRSLDPDAGGSGYAERSVPPATPGAPGARNSTRLHLVHPRRPPRPALCADPHAQDHPRRP
ncbi:MAG: hypothetical protein WAL99_09795 [Pseudonocardiaceae bacterium]